MKLLVRRHAFRNDWSSEESERRRKMVSKEIFLVKKDGAKLWAVQKANGALWQDGVEIFTTAAEAGKMRRKVDTVKVRWGDTGEDERIE